MILKKKLKFNFFFFKEVESGIFSLSIAKMIYLILLMANKLEIFYIKHKLLLLRIIHYDNQRTKRKF